MSENKIAEFYDNFVENQKSTGINDRIYLLYKRMLKYGLNKNSNVLELGCGIGAFTHLLLKTVKKGNIEAVDLSPQSIDLAKRRIKNKRVSFFSDDITTYKPKLKKIDIITLFDIIEHVPKEKHIDLFQNIGNYINDNTLILINIPNPKYIEYDQIHQPEVLQIIDQPIYLDFILKSIRHTGLRINYFETYSIWVKDEYNFLVLEKDKVFTENKLHEKRSFFHY